MKAVQFSEYGEPDVLHVAEVEEPHAGPGQIRIAVRAAGVNPIDWKVRVGDAGRARPSPRRRRPGRTSRAWSTRSARASSDVAVGDEVFGFAIGGGAAEHTLLAHYARKPPELSWEEAGGLAVAVETASRTLDLLGVGEGQTVLITGAAGGVGTAAVQLARLRGARVIGTASERNHDFLRSLGAEPTTYGDGLVERVRALAPDGVDRALDTAGRGALPDLIELTGDAGNVVTIADFSAPKLGVRVSSGSGTERAYYALADAARYAQEGRFSLPVERAFAFADAARGPPGLAGGPRAREARARALRSAPRHSGRRSRADHLQGNRAVAGGARAGPGASTDGQGRTSVAAPPSAHGTPSVHRRRGFTGFGRLGAGPRARQGRDRRLQGDRGRGLPGGDLQRRARRGGPQGGPAADALPLPAPADRPARLARGRVRRRRDGGRRLEAARQALQEGQGRADGARHRDPRQRGDARRDVRRRRCCTTPRSSPAPSSSARGAR